MSVQGKFVFVWSAAAILSHLIGLWVFIFSVSLFLSFFMTFWSVDYTNADRHLCSCLNFVFPDFPPQVVMNELNSYSIWLKAVLSMYMSSIGIDVFVTHTVHELLWGFKDPLLSKIHSMKPDVEEYFGLMWKVSMVIPLNNLNENSCSGCSGYFSSRQAEASVLMSCERCEIGQMRWKLFALPLYQATSAPQWRQL